MVYIVHVIYVAQNVWCGVRDDIMGLVVERWVMFEVDWVIVLSWAVVGLLGDAGYNLGDRLYVVGYGLEDSLVAQSAVDMERMDGGVLCVGCFSDVKGWEDVEVLVFYVGWEHF